MKNLPILFLIVFSNQLFSQKTTIAGKWKQNNAVYTLIKNPITISVKNYNCRKIIVKAELGEIQGSNCNYIYTLRDSVNSKDKLKIGVKNWFKVNWIDSIYLEVRNLPDPSIRFAMASNGDSVTKAYLQANSAVFSAIDRFSEGFEVVRSLEEKVISFTLKIVRRDSIMLSEKNFCQKTPCNLDSLYTLNSSGKWEFYETRDRDISKEALNFIFSESIPGDRIIFEDIIVNMFGKENRKIDNLTLTIED
jgi:hypothetical protein